jgi:hypothetical protein
MVEVRHLMPRGGCTANRKAPAGHFPLLQNQPLTLNIKHTSVTLRGQVTPNFGHFYYLKKKAFKKAKIFCLLWCQGFAGPTSPKIFLKASDFQKMQDVVGEKCGTYKMYGNKEF